MKYPLLVITFTESVSDYVRNSLHHANYRQFKFDKDHDNVVRFYWIKPMEDSFDIFMGAQFARNAGAFRFDIVGNQTACFNLTGLSL